MKFNLRFATRFATLASLTLAPFIAILFPAIASTFTETEIDQTQVIAITKPYGDDKFDLLIIEQIPQKKQCWAESGTAPVMVEPLLLNFDFTGICRRATDSNGYSMRIDGEDYGLEYLMRLVPRGNELLLVATNRKDAKQPDIVIGRTQGLVRGFMKIELNPGWKFSKRTFGKKVLGHYYFSTTAAAINAPIEPEVLIEDAPKVDETIPDPTTTPDTPPNADPAVTIPESESLVDPEPKATPSGHSH